jgi:hypothetical protein
LWAPVWERFNFWAGFPERRPKLSPDPNNTKGSTAFWSLPDSQCR